MSVGYIWRSTFAIFNPEGASGPAEPYFAYKYSSTNFVSDFSSGTLVSYNKNEQYFMNTDYYWQHSANAKPNHHIQTIDSNLIPYSAITFDREGELDAQQCQCMCNNDERTFLTRSQIIQFRVSKRKKSSGCSYPQVLFDESRTQLYQLLAFTPPFNNDKLATHLT